MLVDVAVVGLGVVVVVVVVVLELGLLVVVVVVVVVAVVVVDVDGVGRVVLLVEYNAVVAVGDGVRLITTVHRFYNKHMTRN